MINHNSLMLSNSNALETDAQQYVIALGASAGGMQEINSFFDNTPVDGVSYVIIQHLSQDYKSVMASLLAKHSKLQICEAEDNMILEKNKIYLTPSKNYMTLLYGRLKLTEKQKTGVPHLTINTFFKSLALAVGKKAIGIILSGTGSDGTIGVEAIKNAGGMIIVSDPLKAEYGEMPSNAIDTGLVDYVLLPEQMPKIIEEYVKEKGDIAVSIAENEHEGKEHEEKFRVAIIDLIKEKLPNDFSDYKPATIMRRIKRRAAYNNINNIEAYLNFLKTTPDEVNALSHDFLISVTSFFRDQEAFNFFKTNIIPEIISNKSNNDELKIWVAGCATGEEAYSFAILVKEQLQNTNKNLDVKIFATDVDIIAINSAKKGVYDDNISKAVSPERLELFFTKESNGYKVKPAIRKMLIFAQHDLVKNAPYCNMDVISCRNLLIYMNQLLQGKILAMLQFGLKKNGYLFLGPSENIIDRSPFMEEVNAKWKIYKSLQVRRNINFDVFTPVTPSERRAIPAGAIIAKELQNKHNGLKDYLNETLISELGYVGVCVDENSYVVQIFGDISKFVLHKMFSFHLTDVLPKPLFVAYKNASHEAIQQNKRVEVNNISIGYNGLVITVNLIVIPLDIKKIDKKLMLVFFNEVQVPVAADNNTVVFNENTYATRYILNLEEELLETKEILQDVLEKLDASNENLQSFNEELLSTNEEMQSTNEEMQSINEELHSMNGEYQLKIKELSDLNDDLNNYFRSNVNGQLFINKEMLLMKFSPGAVKHINLLDTDIGRPISNISTNIKKEILEGDAKEVITNGGVITKEVEAINGKWYQMMTMPYLREKDNHIDGAIITFNDISELKKAQTELDKSNKTLKTINADLDNFVYSASHDLLGPLNNIEHVILLLDEKKDEFDDEVKHYHQILHISVSKFKALIRDLAVVGKIESEALKTEPVDLAALIDEIKSSIQDKITSAKASIYTNLNVKEIKFSKKNLRSIFYNLISNAIKFKSAEQDPQITITTSSEKDLILLSVQDNGMGIEEEEIENIFSMYKRIHKNVEGQGIGLYLIKKIVDASGGKVIIESKVGKGSTFKIFFKVQ